MNNYYFFLQNKNMKTSTKILFILLLLSFVGFILFIPDLIGRINLFQATGNIVFNLFFYIEIALFILFQICLNILFIRFITSLKFSQMLFFSIIPVSIMFASTIFSVLTLNTTQSELVKTVARVLNVDQTNTNSILWAIALTIVYIIIMVFILWIACKPLNRVSKAVERLSDGKVRNEIVIGGSKQFKDIEYGLNKINENYKDKENLIKATKNEYQKFIPKQFLKYLGKSSIVELESGNQVKKIVTTLFCDIRNSTSTSATLSLEDNFKYINSYIKSISPLIRKHNGFIDKFLGDGILAVFPSAQEGIECANAIIKLSQNKKYSGKIATTDIGVSVHTGEVVFGVVGEEARKSPTIISDSVNYASKIEEFNKEFGTSVVFSKATLNALPSSYPIAYRYVGLLNVNGSSNTITLFESLEHYEKEIRNKLLAFKNKFESAVKDYNLLKYDNALKTFEEIYKKQKQDNVCYIYYNKCQEKLKNRGN